MGLDEILLENKIAISEKWVEAVLSTYSAEGVRFFKKEADRFANPLGYSAKIGLEAVYEAIRTGQDFEELPTELEQFVKLRAVQTFSASDSVSFVFSLKNVVVEVCGKDLAQRASLKEWFDFEARIDRLALKIFDLYMENRELIYQIKVKEYMSGNHVLAGSRCPSATTRNNKEEKIELKVMQEC